ncbi:hypothetical protein FA10DRAFT_286427 [Acaromyces ingoldii]|uniref:Uncharacterized protein n=1 Tax=Acaromyces ingoldii TaxID=215250 RepID=A0A316YQ11_9BASI|nr:hypothetical protein FA10DRAFT_286427 [Acaromyces ingoldii]PWN90748.1 hypothetical protein FA10DRAFT_286427 [Acaromyces ingoldii]
MTPEETARGSQSPRPAAASSATAAGARGTGKSQNPPTSATFSFRQPFDRRSTSSSARPRASMQPASTTTSPAASPMRAHRSKVPLSTSMSMSMSMSMSTRSKTQVATTTSSLGKRRESSSSSPYEHTPSEECDEFGLLARQSSAGIPQEAASQPSRTSRGSRGPASPLPGHAKMSRSETVGHTQALLAPPTGTSTRLPISNSLRATIARPRTTSLLSNPSKRVSPSQQQQQQASRDDHTEGDPLTKRRATAQASKEPPSSFKMHRAPRLSMPASSTVQRGARTGPATPSSASSSASRRDVTPGGGGGGGGGGGSRGGGQAGAGGSSVKDRAKAWETGGAVGRSRSMMPSVASTPVLFEKMKEAAATVPEESPLIRGPSIAHASVNRIKSQKQRGAMPSQSSSSSSSSSSATSTSSSNRRMPALPTPEARQRGMRRISHLLEQKQKETEAEKEEGHGNSSVDDAEAALQRDYVAMANKANLGAAEMKAMVTQGEHSPEEEEEEAAKWRGWRDQSGSVRDRRRHSLPSTPARSERDDDDDEPSFSMSPSEEARQRKKESSSSPPSLPPSQQQQQQQQEPQQRNRMKESVGLDVTLAKLTLERSAGLASVEDESLLLEGEEDDEGLMKVDELDWHDAKETRRVEEREKKTKRGEDLTGQGKVPKVDEKQKGLREENERLVEEVRRLRQHTEAVERERDAAQRDASSLNTLRGQLEAGDQALSEERAKSVAYRAEVDRKKVQQVEASQLTERRLQEALVCRATMAWGLASSAARAEVEALSGERDMCTFLLAQLTVWQRAVLAEIS